MGVFARRVVMSSAGTWPSMRYFSTCAVWQERTSRGTPRLSFTLSMSSSSCTTVLKPAAFTWSTHLAQQPQVGLM